MNSRGRRFIGDHIASYAGDDLVLVPPDLPHTWSSTERIDSSAPQVALVIWFSGDWVRRMADCCPEYASLRKLLRRGAPGLSFGTDAAAAMRARLPALLDDSPRVRLSAVLDTLAELADAEAAEPLASPSAHVHANAGAAVRNGVPVGYGLQPGATTSEAERLNRVLDLLDRRFNEPLRIADLCDVANLSERSLHRYFIRHVGESVGRYLGRLRISYATRQLTDTEWPIAVVASKAGFPSVANFNRQFLAARGMTPSAYRRFFETHGHAPHAAKEATTLETRSPSLEPRTRKRAATS
jgi:AraC-like DNA-binding protein